MMRSALFRFSSELRSGWPFVTIVVLGLALLLTNLGTDYLWADEGDTAVLASSILKFGVPKAWDGVTFTDSDLGARENQQLTMVSTPWVQYYVAAASFLFFGENTFAARFPFALASLFTVLVGFRFIQRLTGDWRPAFCGALLLLLSVQFLLYAREARYYALSMLFTCLAVSIFFKMKSVRDAILFAVVSILLFHTHPLTGALLVTLTVLTLSYRPFLSQRRWFWLACVPISVFTVPWFFYARGGYTLASKPAGGIGEFSARILQYLLEVASITPLIGGLLLLIVIVILARRGTSTPGGATTESSTVEATDANRRLQFGALLSTQEVAFLVLVVATIICSSLAISLTQDVPSLRIIGLRYTAGLIPLVALAAGMLIAKVSRGRAVVWVTLVIVSVLTRLDEIVPWVSWNKSGTFRFGQQSVAIHVPTSYWNHFVDTPFLRFFCNLWSTNPGTMGRTAEFLRRYAQPGDVVITNYESEPLYFYTRLPQGLKILANAPIYEAAQQQNLPDYVFSVSHARWIVWRFAWDGYYGTTWSELEQALRQKGAQVTELTKIKETGWENRENVFFHRFCGHRHLFHSHQRHFRRTRIFHVDYPGSQ
ncbi:MAG TPA: glycosyltransferase family 39 protein [Chthoniobacterales bacterium]|nr:glycosyltransferase family 39 protein [Chthoniobacterales bacterium]